VEKSHHTCLRPCLLPEVFCQIAKKQRECAAHQNLTQTILGLVFTCPNFFAK